MTGRAQKHTSPITESQKKGRGSTILAGMLNRRMTQPIMKLGKSYLGE
jgi:hypothetical protein